MKKQVQKTIIWDKRGIKNTPCIESVEKLLKKLEKMQTDGVKADKHRGTRQVRIEHLRKFTLQANKRKRLGSI